MITHKIRLYLAGVLLILLTQLISCSAQAQNQLKVKVINDNNGSVITTDTTFENLSEITTVLESLDLDSSIIETIQSTINIENSSDLEQGEENQNITINLNDEELPANAKIKVIKLKCNANPDSVVYLDGKKCEDVIKVILNDSPENINFKKGKCIQIFRSDKDTLIQMNDDSLIHKIILKLDDKDLPKCKNSKVIVKKRIIILKADIRDADDKELSKLGYREPIGTRNLLEPEELRFSPNPNNGQFHLEFRLSANGNVNIRVASSNGKIVYKEEVKDFSGSYSNDINLGSSEKGIYLLEIKQGEKVIVKKIVVQ